MAQAITFKTIFSLRQKKEVGVGWGLLMGREFTRKDTVTSERCMVGMQI